MLSDAHKGTNFGGLLFVLNYSCYNQLGQSIGNLEDNTKNQLQVHGKYYQRDRCVWAEHSINVI